LNILHFLYKRRFKRKQAPQKTKKRRKSQIKSMEVRGRLAGMVAEDSGSTGLSDSGQGPDKPIRHQSEGTGSKGNADTPTGPDTNPKKEEEEELTQEELEIEQRIVHKGEPIKLFKSFQAHGSGFVLSAYWLP
jgi:hypothetical protein